MNFTADRRSSVWPKGVVVICAIGYQMTFFRDKRSRSRLPLMDSLPPCPDPMPKDEEPQIDLVEDEHNRDLTGRNYTFEPLNERWLT